MESPYTLTEQAYKKYFLGKWNRLLRMYFYLRRGLDLLNDFKYLAGGIIALYAILKLNNAWIMVAIFVGAIPILLVLGYIWTHHAQKSLDWFNIEYSTYFGKYNVELQEKQLKTTEGILKELKEGKQ